MALTLHTSLGNIKVELFCEETPSAAENFLALAASGYYDNTIFHRNIASFIVQGGDPTGTGKGGKSIWGGKFADEVCESLKFNQRGQLAMANNGPNTNRSQFFITYAKQPNLNGKHTIFGRVIHGWDTLDAMERSAHGEDSITLRCITIHANPLASLGQLSSR